MQTELAELYAQLDGANQSASGLLQQYWVGGIFSDDLYINGGNRSAFSNGKPFIAFGLVIFGDISNQISQIKLTEARYDYYDNELKIQQRSIDLQRIYLHKEYKAEPVGNYEEGKVFIWKTDLPQELQNPDVWHDQHANLTPATYFKVQYVLSNGNILNSVLLYSKPNMLDFYWNFQREKFYRVNTQENAIVGESLLPFQGEMDRFWSPWMDAFRGE